MYELLSRPSRINNHASPVLSEQWPDTWIRVMATHCDNPLEPQKAGDFDTIDEAWKFAEDFVNRNPLGYVLTIVHTNIQQEELIS